MPYIHLPLQSASDRILRAMARDYTIDEYRRLLARLRERVPDLAVSTDIIVGFPGEDEADVAATADFLVEARYDFAYLFKYSSRPGTRAAKMAETVSEAEKGRRLRDLIDLQEKIGLAKNQAQIGREVEVLVDGPARRPPGHLVGKSRNFKTTVFPDTGALPGELVRVRVERATAHTLLGRA
jgi:tRNA-2-methylthio-N6-dimethylallyladenosine synthase